MTAQALSAEQKYSKMGPTPKTDNNPASAQQPKAQERPRRSSLPELKSTDKSAEKKVPTGPRANPLYKTRLCMNFQSTGSCPYTDKCQFAHGVKELEKWEAWRTSHKGDDQKPDGPQSEGTEPRSRSQSFEKSIHTPSLEGSAFGSPQSASSFDISTPVMSSVSSVLDETPFSLRSNFSLWSAKLDELDSERTFRPELRGRAATFDSTYDNMAQLSDAPTLFSSPPVLPSLGRLSFPH